MRNNVLRLLLTVAVAVPALCSAEILVFKGSMNMRRSGGGGESRHPYRTFVIIDRDSGNVGKIDYYTVGGFYCVNPVQNLSASKVALAGGRQMTVLAAAATTMTETNQVTVTSTFVRGTDGRLVVNRGATTVFPRLLDWNDRGVVPTADGSTSTMRDETGVLSFDQVSTVYGNSHSETLADEQSRLINYLQSKGYREIVVK